MSFETNQTALKSPVYFVSSAGPVKCKDNSARHLCDLKFSSSHIKRKKTGRIDFSNISSMTIIIISTCNQHKIIMLLFLYKVFEI